MNTIFFTGAGDDGLVTVSNDSKKKSDVCFHVLGLCDEVNVCAGHAAIVTHEDISAALFRIQELLFIAQADIAQIIFGGERKICINTEHISEIEEIIFKCDEKLSQIKTFIIPRGSEGALRIEFARVRSREFERVLIMMSDSYNISEDLKKFSNRLSSVFFALARLENSFRGAEEVSPQYK